jgi:8-oxo-dGTP diphosphatase
MMKEVHVAVGVIMRDEQIFLTKRHEHVHQGGKWEFPGGKVEKGETVAQALLRELKEEVAIDILACQPFMLIEHDYGDKKVRLDVYIVDQFMGEPCAQEGQKQAWYKIKRLNDIDFPKANIAIVEKLQSIFN